MTERKEHEKSNKNHFWSHLDFYVTFFTVFLCHALQQEHNSTQKLLSRCKLSRIIQPDSFMVSFFQWKNKVVQEKTQFDTAITNVKIYHSQDITKLIFTFRFLHYNL